MKAVNKTKTFIWIMKKFRFALTALLKQLDLPQPPSTFTERIEHKRLAFHQLLFP